uniref:Mannose-6-phosphate isomerase / glucose-6-phosphate isomerase n=1 Tax=Caldiarchaeum subterraneum TaxID=311458 RepID=E6NBL6_CALS0|nr:mannose-6-phosphate isomerase / glucose-6-phosphate isomerase [Candidatus Caldarchaeum subterraneum]
MSVEEGCEKAWRMVLSSPTMYREGFSKGETHSNTVNPAYVRRIFIAGVGGSGIVGDIISAIRDHNLPPPVETLKTFRLPGYTGPDTLLIPVSYSGDTVETSWAFVDGFSKSVAVVGVSSGGRLTSLMEVRRLRVVKVSEGLQPRYAVPEMVGAVYGLLTGFEAFPREKFLQAVDELETYAKKFSENGLQQMVEQARPMLGRHVVIVSADNLYSAAYRLKCQLNENAKHPCHVATAPEAFHNEVEGWTNLGNYCYVFLRSGYEQLMVSDGLDWMKEYLRSNGAAVIEIGVKSSSPVSELLKFLLIADLLSLGLACLKKVDPIMLHTIPKLRPILRRHLP